MDIVSKNILEMDGFKTMPYETNNKLFYGVELEVETLLNNWGAVGKAAEEADKDLHGHVNIRPEGTVSHGFEIVTIPATLAFHKQKLWGSFFENGAQLVHASERTGLHVHFSRDALTEKQLAKVIYFIHDTGNGKFLSKVAGRAVSRDANWCRQRQKTFDGTPEKSQEIIREETISGRGCISISSHYAGKSVECRIFKSNPTRQGVFQALEFLDALIAYCAKCSDAENSLSHTNFIDWFQSNSMKLQYPYFYENLVKTGSLEKGWRVLLKKVAS